MKVETVFSIFLVASGMHKCFIMVGKSRLRKSAGMNILKAFILTVSIWVFSV